ncbi:TetR/AcrR family transcriptional regulator [Paenibacillus hamazuiensis]|uniref:TetR/AcrR family transcriptional regulator n=1 Tax=Paenibacillus hamazuiensis TaxID=2936508 RepID=UPI0020107A40|nr:TetR/AcrR family transcriptional regulator [Paenibacillus hamazuiensis]
MNDKKTQLILAAMKLFGERDYHTASVQDIVSLAGVSKGAFYQYFQSKEELLLSIFKHYFDRIGQGLRELLSDSSLDPREVLIRGIRLQCQSILENQDFLCMMVKGIAFTEKSISELMAQGSVEHLQWLQERIVALYGPELEAHSMDCAAMLAGYMKEYFFLNIFFQYPIDSAKLSEYLAARLDDLVSGIRRSRPAPLLETSLGRVLLTGKGGDPGVLAANTERIRSVIRTQIGDERTVSAMLQSLDTIEEELNKEHGNEIIVRGMYSYLLSLAKENQPLVDLLKTTFASRIEA